MSDLPGPLNVRGVYVYYGPNFASSVNLNDLINWRCLTASTLNGVEQEIVLQDTIYSHPFEERVNIKERVFSIKFEPSGKPNQPFYGAWLFNALDGLKKKLYSGPLRIVFCRGTVGSQTYMYINCRIETIEEVERGSFEAKFMAADPYFYHFDWHAPDSPSQAEYDPNDIRTSDDPESASIGEVHAQVMLTGDSNTDAEAGQYLPIPIPYDASAPSDPLYVFQIGGRGGIWTYYRDIPVTNNAPYPLRNHPICIDLGNLSAFGVVGNPDDPGATPSAKFWETGGLSHDHNIKDIRVEGTGGNRHNIFIRDSGNHGGTWHQNVKVWVLLYELLPGASTTLRVLYGNIAADPKDIYPEPGSLKCMFTMYDSDNSSWTYSDFMPLWNFPQTRSFQWSAYIPAHDNITWIGYPHPAFDNLTGGVNVGCAGARCQYHTPAWGAGGLQLTLPIGIASISYNARISTNDKTPFLLRWQRRNGEWVDSTSGQPGYHVDSTSVANVYSTTTVPPGGTFLLFNPGTVPFVTGLGILLPLDDGSVHRATVTSVFPANLNFTPGIPSGRYAVGDALVTGFKTLTGLSKSFSSADYPLTLAFILRGDHPEFSSGEWYFGGVESLTITFSSTEKPTVLAWSSATEINIYNLSKFQLIGLFGNTGTNEYLYINMITHNVRDQVVIDCGNREVWYYAWNIGSGNYDPPVRRIESLTFQAVRFNWIHIDPFAANTLYFAYSPNSNFRDMDVSIYYPLAYY